MKRREFIQLVAASSITSACTLNAEGTGGRGLTVSQTEGPFYPVEPIAESNNLLRPGHQGSVLSLSGSVFDINRNPLPDARVEIWQCDARGIYKHPKAPATESFDLSFEGAGATTTDDEGRYHFTTIVPVPYTGRPPHIHTKILINDVEKLTSQIYLADSGGHKDLKVILTTADNQKYSTNFDFVINS